MKKHTFLALICSISTWQATAQSTTWAVGSTADTDYGYSFHPSTGSTAIVAGKTASYLPFSDFLYSDGLLSKIDIFSGQAAWTRTYRLAVPNIDNINYDKSDIFWRTRATPDGGSITVGASGDTLGLPSLGLTILKTDGDGVPQWSKFISGNGFANAAYDVTVVSDGYVLAGTILPANATQGIDIAMAKFDLNGDVVWSKNIGGAGTQSARAMAQTADGGFMLVGATTPQGGSGATSDILVVKTNANGTVQWAKTYGNPNDEDRATAIAVYGADNIIIGGFYKNGAGAGMEDMFVMRIDGLGNVTWKTILGTPNIDYLNGLSSFGQTDNILVSGYYTVSGNDKNAVWAQLNPLTGALVDARQHDYGIEDVFYESLGIPSGAVFIGNTSVVDSNNDVLLNSSNPTSSNGCNGTPWLPIVTQPVPFSTAAVTLSSNVAGVVKEFPFMTNLVAVQTTDICLPVAISRSENRLVAQIAPNPNKGQFRITVADPAQLQLTDALGRLVAQQTIAAGTTSIDTQSLTNGIYFLYLKDNQGRKALEKIMVQQ